MNRLISRLAAASEIAPEQAADELDKLLHRLVTKLRRGEPARLPGLGSFTPGADPGFKPEPQDDKHRRIARRSRRTAR